MKNFLLLIFLGTMISCSIQKKSYSSLKEDELFHTRKYIGNFDDCYHAAPEISGGVNLIWIITTLYTNYGQLSVYGKGCEFSPGDQLFLRSRYSYDGSFGNWEYFVENESAVSYRLSEFRHEDKVLVQRMVK